MELIKPGLSDEDQTKRLFRIHKLLIDEHNIEAGVRDSANFANWVTSDWRPRMRAVHTELNNIRPQLIGSEAEEEARTQLKQSGMIDTQWDAEIDVSEI